MANILDYLHWRGDLSYGQLPFCVVDALVLCRLSYVPLDGIVSGDLQSAPVTIGDAAKTCLALVHDKDSTRRFRLDDDERLLTGLIESERFRDLPLVGYRNVFDAVQQEQFSAVTVLLPQDELFVAYRGTDGTIVGWREDFNMSFTDIVPAQKDALAYLSEVAAHFPGKLRIGGHSKGGNLAVYAATFCMPETQSRILSVTNQDGPGFGDRVMQDARYARVLDRIHTYVPQSSIIGMLLEHEEDFSVVHSNNHGIMQHDVYSWEIFRGDFVTVGGITNSSRFIDRTLKDWVRGMTAAQREKMIDGIFSVLGASDGVTLRDLWNGKNTISVVRAIANMDDETRGILKATFTILKASAKKELPAMLSQWAESVPTAARLLSMVDIGTKENND